MAQNAGEGLRVTLKSSAHSVMDVYGRYITSFGQKRSLTKKKKKLSQSGAGN